jgi:hypothetical protein
MLHRFHGDTQGAQSYAARDQATETTAAAAAAAGTAANHTTEKFFRIKHNGSPFSHGSDAVFIRILKEGGRAVKGILAACRTAVFETQGVVSSNNRYRERRRSFLPVWNRKDRKGGPWKRISLFIPSA